MNSMNLIYFAAALYSSLRVALVVIVEPIFLVVVIDTILCSRFLPLHIER